jgi:hypothetical protein
VGLFYTKKGAMQANTPWFLIAPLLTRLLIDLFTNQQTQPSKKRKKEACMFLNFRRRRAIARAQLFTGGYIDVNAFYAVCFREVPCICVIPEIDVTKAFEYISTSMSGDIVALYQYYRFDHTDQQCYFQTTLFVLANNRMIELGSAHAAVLHSINDYNWAGNVVQALAIYRMDVRPAPASVIGFTVQSAMN